MSIGPVEYIVVGFPGNEFKGEIAPALADLVDNGTIKIHDIVFITKDADGDFGAVEFDEHDGLQAFASIDGEVGGVISNEDIADAAEALEPDSSAALIVWEDLWANRSSRPSSARQRGAPRGRADPHDLIEPVLSGL